MVSVCLIRVCIEGLPSRDDESPVFNEHVGICQDFEKKGRKVDELRVLDVDRETSAPMHAEVRASPEAESSIPHIGLALLGVLHHMMLRK